MFEEQQREEIERNDLPKANKKYLFGVVAGIVVIGIITFFAWQNNGGSGSGEEGDEEIRGIAGDPKDIVLDFYKDWLDRRVSTSTPEDAPDPRDSEALSVKLQEKLRRFDLTADDIGQDPVLCQSSFPPGFRSRTIFENDNAMQVMVLSKDKTQFGQSVASLTKHGELWEISDINCNTGEEGPEIGEFSFDQTGALLKDNLPERFDKNYWHLVYTQNDVEGFTAALIIDQNSTCVMSAGNEEVCNTGAFYQTMRVHVQGQMTEGGVEVQRIEVLE